MDREQFNNAQKRITKKISNTYEIEKTLDGFLCPMQMFLELNREGWNPIAFRILAHDLNVKRVLITKVTLSWFNGIKEEFFEIIKSTKKGQ